MVNNNKELVNYKTEEIIPKEKLCVTLSDTLTLGDILQQSGMFPGVTNKAQAVAKILLGRELGLGPVYSLLKIHLIATPNRPATLQVSAELVAGLINRSQHYQYQIAEHTDTECVVNFLKDGELVYPSRFTIEDARRAGLVKPESNWVKWPRSMLWARAITQGQKIVCPELTAGADVMEDIGYDVSPNGEKSKAGEPPPSAWMHFWGEARKRGYKSEEAVHTALKVASLQDWIAEGKTLDDAIAALPNLTAARDADELFGKKHHPEAPNAAPTAPTAVKVENTPTEAGKGQPEGKQGAKAPKISLDRIDQLSRALTAAGYLPGEVREALFKGMKITKLADLDTAQGDLLEAWCKRKQAENEAKAQAQGKIMPADSGEPF